MSKLPLILDSGRKRELLPSERIPLQHVPVYVERTLEWEQRTPNRFQQMMDAGVVVYTLPAVPTGAIEVQINGVGVNFTLVGDEITVTEYAAELIEDTDELTVYYHGAAVVAEMVHELVVAGEEVVMTEAA